MNKATNDIVWLIGSYLPPFDEIHKEPIKAKIYYIRVYKKGGVRYKAESDDGGEWSFSNKHIGKCVFDTKAECEARIKELRGENS